MACPDTPATSTCFLEVDAAMQSLAFMNQLRKAADGTSGSSSGCLCDAKLLVNGRTLFAHRVVLASSSQYFAAIFTPTAGSNGFEKGSSEETVDITERLSDSERIDTASFEALIEYAYTKRVCVSELNVHALFQAADCLRFNGVKAACFKFLGRLLDVDNCLKMWLFAKGHQNANLAAASLAVIEQNFVNLSRTAVFLDLPLDYVVEVLRRDDLCVMSEEDVYKVAMSWVRHKSEERQIYIGDVLAAVRLQLLPHDSLMAILENEPSVQNDLKCIPQLIAAIEYKVKMEGVEAPTRSSMDEIGVVQPRRPCMNVEEIHINRAAGNRLGVAVMGGVDRPGHVFQRGTRPCVRVTQVYPGGAAAASSLQPGDEVLAINGRPAEHLQHEQAIALIAKPSETITLLIRHAQPPPGLMEFTLSTNRGLGFGLCIEGGANASPGNPLDPDDDGIFISQILPGGAAEQSGKLKAGHRILQVNSISLLGATHGEALQAMRQSTDRLHLMVCDGFDQSLLPPNGSSPDTRRNHVHETMLPSGRRTSLQTDLANCIPY